MNKGRNMCNTMKLFDSHCHLQDPRILNVAPQLIEAALNSGVRHFAVNGVSENDWHLVKQLSDKYPCVVPCFGLHPWYVAGRTPFWFNTLKDFCHASPAATVGEIGLDKGSHGRKIGFADQVEVFQQQLELAKELKRPVSVHCVRAFGDLLQIMQHVGPFPAGVILHSYLGSAEMVPELAKLGAYFSFSGYLMSLKEQKAKKMLKTIPLERILLESDAPDALPKSDLGSLFWVEKDSSAPKVHQTEDINLVLSSGNISDDSAARNKSVLPQETLNHPANIHNVLLYVASFLGMSKEELAEISYRNAVRLFSFEGSKITPES